MRKIEYSQIVRRKLKELKEDLTVKYGEEFSKKTVGEITTVIKRLETDYYYLFVNHNYFIYRIEPDKIIIVNMFNEKEDIVMKLFGLSGRTQESIDYWGE